MKLTPSAKQTIGERLVDWAGGHNDKDPAKKRLVAIHTWDHTYPMTDSQNDGAESIFKKKIPKPPNMFWRKSSRTGIGFSHHQKFVVMDAKGVDGRRTIRAFIGGLDLTQGRMDWPDHPIWPDHPDCQDLLEITNHGVHEWYNAEFTDPPLTKDKKRVDAAKTTPRQPWHDIHCQMVGPTAWDLVREFMGRWHRDPSARPCKLGGDGILSTSADMLALFSDDVLFDKKRFIQQWEPHSGEWTGQILRSQVKDHWEWKGGKSGKPAAIQTPAKPKGEFQWSIKKNFERSIQDSYLQAIADAEKYIYIETQYFIGSGTEWINGKRSSIRNEIPDALTRKIRAKISAKEPFHVYLILPMYPEGNPSGTAGQAQRDFQWNSLASVIRGIQEDQSPGFDWRDYFTVGFLANWKKVSKLATETGFRDAPARRKLVIDNCRHMIYVHSKFMLVDDRYAIIGSANLNERSLAGDRDSEICVALWPRLSKEKNCITSVRAFRERLWEEHFGGKGASFDDPGSPLCVTKIRQIGDANWKLLSAGKTQDGVLKKSGHFVRWPIDSSRDDLGYRARKNYIFDGLTGRIRGDDWYWWPTDYTGIIYKSAAE